MNTYVDNSLADLRKTISKDFKSMLTSTLNDVMKPTPRLEGDVNLRKRDRDPTDTDVGSVFGNLLPKQRKNLIVLISLMERALVLVVVVLPQFLVNLVKLLYLLYLTIYPKDCQDREG